MTVGELKNTLATLAFIVGTAFIIDARYELAGAERRAVLSANIYTNTIQIAGKASVVHKYDIDEADDSLTPEERARLIARRQRVMDEKQGLIDHSRNLQAQLDAL